MIRPEPAAAALPPAILRLSRLVALADDDVALLRAAIGHARTIRVRKELTLAGQRIAAPQLIVAGWGARVKILVDGRRQFLSFLLPGDLIGLCRQPRPVASATVVALTDLTVCTPPPEERSPALADAYAVSRAMEEAYLLAQIVRLGRLSAHEKIADLFLELDERLALAGLASHGRFDLPLTQEMLADTLGLTSVHVNRMVQQLRRSGDLSWTGREVKLHDPVALARQIGRQPAVVTR